MKCDTEKIEINKLVDSNSIVSSLFVSLIIMSVLIFVVLELKDDLLLVILLLILGVFILLKLSENETLTLTNKSIIYKKYILYGKVMDIKEIELSKIRSFDCEITYTIELLFLKYILPGPQFIKSNRVIINLKDGQQKIYKFRKLKYSLNKFVEQANHIINNEK